MGDGAATPATTAPASQLPWGRSHWDRLPRELHDMVLRLNTLFGRLRRGDLLRAELACLGTAQREELWAAVFAADWQGDLALLPELPRSSKVFEGIRTRSMLERTREASLIDFLLGNKIAIHNRWLDLVSYHTPFYGILSAIFSGELWYIEELVDVRRIWPIVNSHASMAAAVGTLEIMKYVHDRMPAHEWPYSYMRNLGTENSVEVVQYLIERHPDLYDGGAMREAASRGNLAVMQLLERHGIEASPRDLIRVATSGGHLHVLQYLHGRFPDCFDKPDIELLAYSANVGVLEFFHTLGMIPFPLGVLEHLLRKGAADCAKWVVSTLGLAASRSWASWACVGRSAAVFKWLVDLPGVEIDATHIRWLVASGSVDVLDVLVRHDMRRIRMVRHFIVERNDAVLAEWLLVRHPRAASARMLRAAELQRRDAVAALLRAHGRG
ncbi:hypothetical protein HK105_207802 [Polyrhizophydium stewartii]|uniref:Ankyrin repeat protein n=1 Tax=Polyrhizophydium stewartii TaxID=2732419 RepID=A0ABR4MZN3_9FUNG